MREENPLKKMFEYNLWANVEIIEFCMGLSEEQLAVEVDGVYGRIQTTLAHLLNSEGGYLNRMTGTRPWEDALDLQSLSLEELLPLAKRSGNRLVEIAAEVDFAHSHTITAPWGKPFTFFNWTVVLQALYHGIEHRTQIKILLTKLGIEHSDLSAWSYLESFPFNEM